MTSNSSIAVQFDNVFKSYIIKGFLKNKTIRALNGVSFKVNKKEIVGLFGLNGAGKTTIIKLICGLLTFDSGAVEVFENPINLKSVEYKKLIGYIPELPYFYPFSTAKNTLDFYYSLSSGGFKNNEKTEEVLRLVGLYERRDEKIKNFSKGMMQRLAIACSLVHDPELLVYDEPTSGLDPISIREIRNIILGLKEKGKTVILSSHSISEAEKICDRVIILHKGEIKKIINKQDWADYDLEKIFIDTVAYGN